MNFKDQTYNNVEIEIDGNHYENCTFNNCRLIYRGGALPIMANCKQIGGGYDFDDAALRTIDLMNQLYNAGTQGREMIERTIKAIRGPRQVQQGPIQ